jgi:hypothetical protein
MRGDSLRDLYAKVIAVVGLGVLAGAGALVDYWPSGGLLPRVATEARNLRLAGPLPVPAVMSVAARPAPRTARIQPVTDTNATSLTPPATHQTATHPTTLASLPVAHRIDLAKSTAVALAAPPPAPAATTSAPQDEPFNAATGSAFSDLPVRFAPPAAIAESDGFIVGAAKKTRDSIVGAGRKTGASIFDAFRFVGGKMKKALPGT